jgi:callose synthase
VLFEVLKAVNVSQKIEVDQSVNHQPPLLLSLFTQHDRPSTAPLQILETHNQVEEKKKLYLPYNILPLDPDSANQAIMRYPEVAACFISYQLATVVSRVAYALCRHYVGRM